ncbi:YaeQ [Burkholderiaceae bacterium]|jgi:uncharacterized protein YaeQ
MALRATIHKVELHISDADRNYYASHSLTLAKHPSETDERMMARVIAFSLQAQDNLVFSKGLSDTDEPDIWVKDLTDAIQLWIEIGQPEERRILKACGRSDQVIIFCYGGQTSKIWWQGIQHKVARAQNLRVIALPKEAIETLGKWVERGMTMHVNVEDGEMLISTEQGQIDLSPELWHQTKEK